MLDGETYNEARDGSRLQQQLERVWSAVADGGWHTLSELADRTGAPEPSVSARLRDLRKARFGGFKVIREYSGDGLWRYRLTA